MAINSLTTSNDKFKLLSLSSLNSSNGRVISNRLVNQDVASECCVTNFLNKSKKTRKNTNCNSPYLNNYKTHLLSCVTEKRVVQKTAADFVSSYPLALKIYKANSDELKPVKESNKRVKKSVLTLPNKRAPAPQTCTVSDMNDSEDFNHDNDNCKKRPKKRHAGQNKRSRNDFEFYDRDARYCSQFNIHLDRSSTDLVRNFNGDGKRSIKRKKQAVTPKGKMEGKFNGRDMWRVLRGINRFQFKPSPPMSDESFPIPQNKDSLMRVSRKDARYIQTCHTEEVAYISSIEVEDKSPTSFSHSSSFDRITVIDKKVEFPGVNEEFENKICKRKNVKNVKNHTLNRNNNKCLFKNTLRTCNKVQASKECKQHTSPNNKNIDVKHSYNNNGILSNYSSDAVNEDSLFLNTYIDSKLRSKNEKLLILAPENHEMQNIIDRSEIENNLKSPANSVSSKTSLRNISKGLKICEEKISNQPLKGITKVVLSKGQGTVPTKRVEISKRKPRLATTLRSASIVPKMTQTDIRRRLLSIKLPLVILDKDQVSSSIQVVDYDPPQFDGLDQHIWPFMIKWSDDDNKLKAEMQNISESNDTLNSSRQCNENVFVDKRNLSVQIDHKLNRAPTRKAGMSAREQITTRETKLTDSNLVSKNLTLDLNNNIKEPKKQKPIGLLKDKMLKLLYRKRFPMNLADKDNQITGERDVQCKTNRDCVNCNDNNNTTEPASRTEQYLNPPKTEIIDKSLVIKRHWAKARWASDFVENIIKKIKNGVYYNQGAEHGREESITIPKGASIQTRLVSEKLNEIMTCDIDSDQFIEQTLSKRNDLPKIIPGFDNSLPELQIQTLDTNKVEIKNCLTNIIVQFDITVPHESDKLGIHTNKSCSLIPLEKNDSNTEIFKCKAKIFNAMLPAELCAILPDMMSKIIHTDKDSSYPLSVNKTFSQLSTISEMSHVDRLDAFRIIPKLYILSPDIRRLLSGKFSHSITNPHSSHRIQYNVFRSPEIVTLLPKIQPKLEHIFRSIACSNTSVQLLKSNNVSGLPGKTCKTLQLYNYDKHSVVPTGHRFNFIKLFENMWTAFKMCRYFNLNSSMRISLDFESNESFGSEKVITRINNLKLDSIFEKYAKIDNDCKGQKALRGNVSEPDISFCECESHKNITQIHGKNHKVKRKSYVKLYKKCKSTSNIPNEKSNLPLSKITNLDVFFQLLGSKSLSCVLDGDSAKMILSSVATMKNWITEINSRQAVLVLLLANKKDTHNLIRFRPVLLQGIAVNRITRSSELDMEIEVIEREHFNGFSQFDGIISYLPASTENKDNLLEELIWIAKTTASDYHKHFDESSEKLLKSLLEKRKQLNPSYLRVMARYVGLGLLKLPTKKNIRY